MIDRMFRESQRAASTSLGALAQGNGGLVDHRSFKWPVLDKIQAGQIHAGGQ